MEPELELKRWTRKEYEALVERGIFTREDRIELIDGLLVVAEPQSADPVLVVEVALSRVTLDRRYKASLLRAGGTTAASRSCVPATACAPSRLRER